MLRPIKELKGFKRLNLNPGEKRTVTFKIAVNQLDFFNQAVDFVVEPDTIQVMVGSSSADIRLTDEFEFIGDTTVITNRTFFNSVDVS